MAFGMGRAAHQRPEPQNCHLLSGLSATIYQSGRSGAAQIADTGGHSLSVEPALASNYHLLSRTPARLYQQTVDTTRAGSYDRDNIDCPGYSPGNDTTLVHKKGD